MNPSLTEDTGKTVTFVDVYQEFNDVIAEKYRIMKFKSMVRKSGIIQAWEIPAEPQNSAFREPDLAVSVIRPNPNFVSNTTGQKRITH